MSVDRDFRSVKNEILNSTGNQFFKDKEFAIGSVGLSLAEKIVKISDEDDDARKILHYLSKVQVGIYRSEDNVDFSGSCSLITGIDNKMSKHGWKYIIKNFEHGKFSIIYVKENPENDLKELFVINMNERELTIVDLKGNLNKLFETIIKDKGLQLSYK
jgi:hypothetical protein